MSFEVNSTVLVDMDGVLADFDGYVEAVIKERHSNIAVLSERTNFNIADDYGAFKDVVNNISLQPGFFSSLNLIKGSIEGWQRIMDAGFMPRICSSPLTRNLSCREEKLLWLTTYFVPIFGNWVVETAIIDKNKSSHDGIALIDDRPSLSNSSNASWHHVVFNKPYNRASEAPFRLYGWKDPNLEDILENCRKLTCKS